MIEQILGRPRGTLTIADLERLVANRVMESQRLEFKREPPARSDPGNREIAKDVAAMCNGGGGLIVYGIDEDQAGHAAGVHPFACSGYRERFQSVISASTHPPIRIAMQEVLDQEGAGLLLLEVRPSPRFPHAVSDGSKFSFPVRAGTTTRYLMEPEIERAYRERLEAREDKLRRAAELRDRLLATSDLSYLWLAVVPLELRTPAFAFTHVSHQRARDLSASREVRGVLGEPLLELNPGIGFRCFVFGDARSPRAGKAIFGDMGEYAATSAAMPSDPAAVDQGAEHLQWFSPYYLFACFSDMLLGYRELCRAFSVSGQCMMIAGIRTTSKTVMLADAGFRDSWPTSSDGSSVQMESTFDLNDLETGQGFLGVLRDPLIRLGTLFGSILNSPIDDNDAIDWTRVPRAQVQNLQRWARGLGLKLT
jgi:hypothetical protein